jgi:hypothetical protein
MRECPGCGREVPIATRECPYCQFVVSRYIDDRFADEGPILHPMPVAETPAEPPTLTPYLVAIAVLVTLGFAGLIYSRINRSSSEAEHGSPPVLVNARPPLLANTSPTNTVANPPAAAVPDWHKVLKVKMDSTVGLASFAIRGANWRITWSTKPPPGRPGSFSLALSSLANPTPINIANTTISQQNTVAMTGPGDYTLDINSRQPCLVMVEEYY